MIVREGRLLRTEDKLLLSNCKCQTLIHMVLSRRDLCEQLPILNLPHKSAHGKPAHTVINIMLTLFDILTRKSSFSSTWEY